MHAGALAGICITQTISPGAKVLYGAVPTTMDLRRMDFCMGSIETAIMNAAAVQIAKLYNLPVYASSGVTEAKRPDIQAGFEKTVSNLLVGMAGGDYIHLAAGMLDSAKAISYEQYVIDDEIIGMVQHLLKGINVNEDTLAFEIIKSVGPSGNFVAEDHTIQHMLNEFYYPHLSIRANFDIWEDKGKPDMLSHAKGRVEKILEDSIEGLLDHDTISEIQKAFPGSRLI
jgi:trimethylamine--corrinoid protein Co-methyltransferase